MKRKKKPFIYAIFKFIKKKSIKYNIRIIIILSYYRGTKSKRRRRRTTVAQTSATVRGRTVLLYCTQQTVNSANAHITTRYGAAAAATSDQTKQRAPVVPRPPPPPSASTVRRRRHCCCYLHRRRPGAIGLGMGLWGKYVKPWSRLRGVQTCSRPRRRRRRYPYTSIFIAGVRRGGALPIVAPRCILYARKVHNNNNNHLKSTPIVLGRAVTIIKIRVTQFTRMIFENVEYWI